MLENSPSISFIHGKTTGTDVAFEDIKDKIGDNGFVFDISHAMISTFNSFKDKDIFPSLKSLEEYIRIAGPNIKWIHLSDSDGKTEGDPIGKGNIDFKKIMAVIHKYVEDPKGVIELRDGHIKPEQIEESLEALKCLK